MYILKCKGFWAILLGNHFLMNLEILKVIRSELHFYHNIEEKDITY